MVVEPEAHRRLRLTCVLDATASARKDVYNVCSVAIDVVFDGIDRGRDVTFDEGLWKGVVFTNKTTVGPTRVGSFESGKRGRRS